MFRVLQWVASGGFSWVVISLKRQPIVEGTNYVFFRPPPLDETLANAILPSYLISQTVAAELIVAASPDAVQSGSEK